LVAIAFLMLKSDESYRYARLELIHEKFTALKIISKGQKATSRTCKIKAALADIDHAELPQVTIPNQLSKGEQKIMASCDNSCRSYIRLWQHYLLKNVANKSGPPRRAAQVNFLLAIRRPRPFTELGVASLWLLPFVFRE